MRTMSGRLLVVMAILVTICSCSASAATARLSVSPQRNLPGMGFSVEIELENGSSDPLVLQPTCTLRVTTEKGEKFVAGAYGSQTFPLVVLGESSEVHSGDVVPIRVEPGRTITLHTPANRHELGAWVEEGRIARPGRYWFSIELDAYQNVLPVKIETPEVEYVVAEPEGVDREVWQRLQRFIASTDEGVIFAASSAYSSVCQFVQEHAPDSEYAPYVVGYDYVPYNKERTLSWAVLMIERFPDSAVVERNRLLAMTLAADVLRGECSKIDGEAMEKFLRANLAALAKSPDPAVRARAHRDYKSAREIARTRGIDL